MSGVDRRRILMLTTQLGYGGAESDFLRLANYLARTSDITIALFATDYGSSHYSAAQSQTTLRTVILDDQPDSRRGVFGKAARWHQLRRSLAVLKNQNDVTISFMGGPNFLNIVTGESRTTIVSERGSKLHHVGIPWLRKKLSINCIDPFVYRRAGRIVPASTDYAQEVAAVAGPSSAAKIVSIEGSIEGAQLLQEADAPCDEDIARFCTLPTAVYAGRLDRGKGIDLLLPVFADVRRKFEDARLLIIGDGPLMSELHDICRLHDLSVTTAGDPAFDVFFAGYRPRPIRHFRLAKTFVFPSLHEGLPNALIEAVASGVPILSSDCPWGPRSILSVSGDPALPLNLTSSAVRAWGTLLPMLNTPEGQSSWELELLRSMQTLEPRRSKDHCRAAIARFDIENTGPIWARLIDDLLSVRSMNDIVQSARTEAGSPECFS